MDKKSLIEHDIMTDDGCYIYALKDPTRPHMRKTGKTTKNQQNLSQKQYSKRYMPKGNTILVFIEFDDATSMNSAEKYLQNNKTKEYRCGDTEWLEFPEDWTEVQMDEYCVKKVNDLQD